MSQTISLRKPTAINGFDVHKLVEQSPPLDTNSLYCNLLQCSHFANTSVAAFIGSELAGFVSGYLIPEQPDTLFIWQVAVSRAARGRGLATKMIRHILERDACEQVTHLETTITEENKASWTLFEGVARHYDANLRSTVLFNHDIHFHKQHDSETLVRIGPFTSASSDTPSLKLTSNA